MWIHTFENELAKYTECPDQFLEAAGFFAAGAALTNRVIWKSPRELSTNLYMILSAPPGRYRKTSAIEFSSDTLETVVDQKEFLPISASMEAMAKSVVPLCRGGYGHGIFIYDELRGFMELVRKEYGQAIMTFLLERWQRSSRPWKHIRKKEGGVDEDVVPGGFILSFFSATVHRWFLEHVAPSIVDTGMASRFLLFYVDERTRSMPDPSGVPDSLMKYFRDDLRAIRDVYAPQTEFKLDPRARPIYVSIYNEIEEHIKESASDDFASVVGRAETYVKKLALLLAAVHCRGDNLIRTDDVEEAFQVVRRSMYIWQGVIEEIHLSASKHGRLISRIKKALWMRGGRMSKRDLIRTVHSSITELDDAIATLEASGIVKREMDGRRTAVVLVIDKEEDFK